MLRKITLKNFFSFREVTIDLNPGANVLVGINGSGKSNFLKAIQLLKEIISGGDIKSLFASWGGFDSMVFAQNDMMTNYFNGITITYELAPYSNLRTYPDSRVHYTINITKDHSTNYAISEIIEFSLKKSNVKLETLNGEIEQYTGAGKSGETAKLVVDSDPTNSIIGNFPWQPAEKNVLRKLSGSIELYEVFDTSRNSVLRKPAFASAEARLSRDGANLALVMNFLKGEQLTSYSQLISQLKEINPNFLGFDYTFFGGNVELSIQEKDLNRPIKINHISDGTLRFIALNTIFCNPRRGDLVCIDEPETGLHPDMVRNLSHSIQTATEKSQLIVSTHCSQLLNHFKLDEILVFDKDNKNSTTITRHSESEFKNWYDNFFPGQMWLSGDLGGTRW